MLLTLLYWMFIFLLMYIIGFSFVQYFLKEKGDLTAETYFFVGFMSMATLSAYLSVFIPLNQWVFLSVIGISLGLYIVHCHAINASLKKIFNKVIALKTVEKYSLLAGCLFLGLMASGEIWVYDTKLYHAQNIQWIQEYAVVPGLAGFQPQFGYNNMFFPVTALFSLEIPAFYQDNALLIYPFNGVVIILLFLKLLSFLRDALAQYDWWRACLYVIVFGCCWVFFLRGLNAPAPDYICSALIIYVFLVMEKAHFKFSDFQILFLSGLIITTIVLKLSALLFSLLLLPLIFTNYSFKKIVTIASLAIFIGLPFLIRNYYLSGYLVFPFPAIDLFSPEWKIANEVVAFEKILINTWAKIPNSDSNTIQAMPFTDWLTIWWGNKDLLWKPLLLTNLFSVVSILVFLKKQKKQLAFLQVAILLNLLFWFYNAPDPRFVFGFLFLGASFTLVSFLLLFDLWKYLNKSLVIGLFSLFILFSLNFHKLYIKDFCSNPVTWVMPKGLSAPKLKTEQTNFNYTMPIRPDLCNNAPIPCATRPLGYMVLRDSTDMQKGFKMIGAGFLIKK